MALGIAAGSGAAAIVAEKTAEVAATAKTTESVAASASLASKIGAVAEKAVKELPKTIRRTVEVEAVHKVAEEIDPSLADAAKAVGSLYSTASSRTIVAGMEKGAIATASDILKEDPDLSGVIQTARYAKATVAYLNSKLGEVVNKAQDGIWDSSNETNEFDSEMDNLKPDSVIEIDGRVYDTDDKGGIYKVDGYELLPNTEYVIDGVKYTTDDHARITSCEGNAQKRPEGERDNIAQVLAGGDDRKPGDQGGHILARILGGAKGIENMLAMRGTAINQSVYKRMENEISRALDEGKEVGIKADVSYNGDSQRPSKITVSYSIDGKDRVIQFDNDEGSTELLSSLEGKIEESDYNDLNQEILDAKNDGVTISVVSVKTIYNESGKAEKIIVTMRDETSEHPVNEDRVFTPKEGV